MTDASTSGQDARVAADLRRKLGNGRRISFVSGNFNVLHPGHLRLMTFAAELGDVLIAGVNPDGTPGVVVPGALRAEGVRALSIVDKAVLLTGSVVEFIEALKPEFVVKGAEFEGRDNPEQSVVSEYGGTLVFGSGETQFSSQELLINEYKTSFSSIVKPSDYPRRHGFQIADLKKDLAKFAGMRVLVIGDTIIDEYITCDPVGMSQEDPTIVVTPLAYARFVGGAGVVASHARGLGADVRFFTVLGDDETAAFPRQELERKGISLHAFTDQTRPTTRKERYRAHGKTLLRVNHLRQHAISLSLVKNMTRQIEEHLDQTDLILFSDFNYGCLPQGFVAAIVERAASRGVMMAADSQASSQTSDISRFKRMSLITPTEREARIALRDNRSGLAEIATQLRTVAGADVVAITLGGEGLLVHTNSGEGLHTDRLPAFNSSPKDVAGAGDSLLTMMSLGICAGLDPWKSAYLGALAAACQVGRVGNAPLSLQDIITELEQPG
jgi:rfaE bifunctional protein kinase chain/domain